MTESSKVFVDTNIWFYSFVDAQDSEKSRIAREVITKVRDDLLISSQVVNEVV